MTKPPSIKLNLLLWLIILSLWGVTLGDSRTEVFPTEKWTQEDDHTESSSFKVRKTFIAHPWIESDKVTANADFSLPPHVQPAPNSGIYITRTVNGVSRSKLLVQNGFKGNIIKQVNMHWKQLEPVENAYRFDLLEKAINAASKNGKYKVELHIKGAVRKFQHFKQSGQKLENLRKLEESAPLWLDNYNIPVIAEKPTSIFQIYNYDIYDSRYHSRYIALLNKLGSTGILENSAIIVIYLHNKSHTRGEEGIGPKEGDPNRKKYLERMDAWAKIAGSRRNIIMETSYEDQDVQAALDRGMGQRNGWIEHYLTHGHKQVLGQGIDRQGYLTVDEEHPLIRGDVASGDENEEYENTSFYHQRFGHFSSFPHRYHESMLRLLQMRRSTVWAEAIKGFIDPALLQFVALELGKTVEDAPDAWSYLRESYLFEEVHRHWVDVDPKIIRSDGSMPLKNFERWLYQRDDPSNRVRTVAVEPRGFGGRQLFRHQKYDYDLTARRTDIVNSMDRMAFAVEDKFLSGPSHRVAIKVTYFDKGFGSFALKFKRRGGKIESRSQSKNNTGKMMTRTYIMNDIDLSACGMDTDFYFEAYGDDLIVRMVRIIKRPAQ